MLRHLSISNYALIDNLEIDFQKGLTIITGETGAGKSIIIGALSLILGQRPVSGIVRDKERKIVVEAVFDTTGYAIEDFFTTNELDYYPTETIVRREVQPGGRSRAFVNDSPVSASLLSELSSRLIDIHSQHSNALLLKPTYQLSIIDSMAADAELLADYKTHYKHYVEARKALADAKIQLEENKKDEDYLEFQLSQLQSANLYDGEQENLEQRQKVLENLTTLQSGLASVCDRLNDGNHAAVESLQSAQSAIDSLTSVYDNAGDLSDRLASTIIEIKDIYQTVGNDLQNLDGEDDNLEAIDERLSTIYSLQQKFHVSSVPELLALREEFQQKLDSINNSEFEIERLEADYRIALQEMKSIAVKLTQTRRAAAKNFIEKLKETTTYLGLRNFKGDVEFQSVDFTPTGCDRVSLVGAFNVNQTLQPIDKIASGGEISRLMLCIKSIIAEKMQLPTIIFDEVDTGVSGEIANKIGRLMSSISKNIQVITITHLPQVAALGEQHLKVYKDDTSDSTQTHMAVLKGNARIREIAGMLSGEEINAAAIANAESLLNNG